MIYTTDSNKVKQIQLSVVYSNICINITSFLVQPYMYEQNSNHILPEFLPWSTIYQQVIDSYIKIKNDNDKVKMCTKHDHGPRELLHPLCLLTNMVKFNEYLNTCLHRNYPGK